MQLHIILMHAVITECLGGMLQDGEPTPWQVVWQLSGSCAHPVQQVGQRVVERVRRGPPCARGYKKG